MSSTMVCRTAQSPSDEVGPKDLNKAFLTALLLAGCPNTAERLVEEAIQEVDSREMSGSGLLLATIKAALRSRTNPRSNIHKEETGPTCSMEGFTLAAELSRVLSLPTAICHSFVLRLLVGLTRLECSKLLQSSPGEIDANVVCASVLLARMNEQENR